MDSGMSSTNETLTSQVRRLNDQYLRCRARSRHKFEDIPDDGGVNRQFAQSATVERLASRCEICGTIRYEAWSAITGEILFATYKYPPDYKVSADPGARNDRRPFRRELIERKRLAAGRTTPITKKARAS